MAAGAEGGESAERAEPGPYAWSPAAGRPHRTARRAPTLSLAGGAVAAIALLGLGTAVASHRDRPGPSDLTLVAAATTRMGSTRVSIEVSSQDNTEATEADAGTGEGLIDFEHDAISISWSGRANDQAVHLEERFIDGDVYLTGDGPLTFSGKWVKFDTSGTASDAAEGADGATGNASIFASAMLNPVNLLRAITSASVASSQIGPESVRGVATTHEQVDADGARLAAAFGGDGLDGAGMPARIAVDIWVDGEGVLRRLDLPSQPDGPGRMRLEFYDFGVPVHITAPPAADVLPDGASSGIAATSGREQGDAG